MTLNDIALKTEQESLELGRCLADCIKEVGSSLTVIKLSGDLGAGKTTMSRGILRSFGHDGQVKSPTYTLVEPYTLADIDVFHFDLYRLGDPEELEFMGIRDYFEAPKGTDRKVICLIEWPEKGGDLIPQADIDIHLSVDGMGRRACVSLSSGALGISLREKIANLFVR